MANGLEALDFKTATPKIEKLFAASFTATLTHYRALLRQVQNGRVNHRTATLTLEDLRAQENTSQPMRLTPSC